MVPRTEEGSHLTGKDRELKGFSKRTRWFLEQRKDLTSRVRIRRLGSPIFLPGDGEISSRAAEGLQQEDQMVPRTEAGSHLTGKDT